MSKLMHITVGNLLDQVAAQYPDDEAVKYIDRPYRRTWREFAVECDQVAKGMLAMGIGKGDHVAIWATNVPEWLITFFACAKIGAVLVTVNTNYKVYELEYLLKQSDSKALVMIRGIKATSYVDIVREMLPGVENGRPGELHSEKLPFLRDIVYVGADTPTGMFNFNDFYAMADDIAEADYRRVRAAVDPQDVTNMQYTSGTTGFPKGVMLTHFNIVNNGKSIGDCMKFTHDDKLCIPVPFFHCFGLVLAVMACLTHASSMVPLEYYNPVKEMQALQDEGCTAVHGVPTMYIGMLEHPDFKKYRFPRLRTGIMAGSPCPMRVMRRVIDEMGMREITITYGQTEASPATTMTTTDDSLELRVQTVGRHMPHVETKIIDPETGREQPLNTPGEFCSRGYNTMKGYYKMPEATARTIDKDGWLHSGDLAQVDENGYYRITGRIKDMIIRGGENIYPKEIEEFLYTHPAVQDVQVVGVPSEYYGEEVAACLVLREGCHVSEEELRDYTAGHIARHKVPKFFLFMESFPQTASGKIQKYRLREIAAEMLAIPSAAESM